MIDRLIEAFDVMLLGMGVVFISLTFFSVLIWALKKGDYIVYDLLSKWRSRKEVKPAEADILNDEMIAVIAAAASEALSKKVKVKKIYFLDTHSDDSRWAVSGRMGIMASHSVRKR